MTEILVDQDLIQAILADVPLGKLNDLAETPDDYLELDDFYEEWERELLRILTAFPGYDDTPEAGWPDSGYLNGLPTVARLQTHRAEHALDRIVRLMTGGTYLSVPPLDEDSPTALEVALSYADARSLLGQYVRDLRSTAKLTDVGDMSTEEAISHWVQQVNELLPVATQRWLSLSWEWYEDTDEPVALEWTIRPIDTRALEFVHR